MQPGPSSIAVERSSASLFEVGHASQFASQLQRVFSGELEVVVHFQPIVDLRTGVVAGYEALARFPREVGLPPNLWLERAGALGLRIDLEHLLCEQALRARKLLPTNCFLTLNAGPDYLLSSRCEQLLEDAINLFGVVIEITEEASIDDYEPLRSRIARIRSMGGAVAVDDAGAGYASLQHILEIKPDFIKLDRHFIQNCNFDRARSTLIEMMGSAAGRLDAWIIAEGVETASELEELMRLGVPLVQGYLTGRPEATMRALESSISALIRSHVPAVQEVSKLERYISDCDLFKTHDAAVHALATHSERRAGLVVDAWRRPVGLVYKHALLGMRRVDQLMKVQVASEPADVLTRAMTREEALRFDPVVVTGPEGQALGILTIDHLVSSAIGVPATPRPTTLQ